MLPARQPFSANFLSTSRVSFSVAALLIANTTPLWGVLFWGWNLFEILFLYWLESAVVGFYNIFKMILINWLMSIFMIPFFIIHYGGFMMVHATFIFTLFGGEFIEFGSFLPSRAVLVPLIETVKFPLLALLISHGISFLINFIGKREYEHADVGKQMHAPYKRIIIMHLTILFGGWLILLFKAPMAGLILLIVFKTIADIFAHNKEHAGNMLTPASSIPNHKSP